MNTIQIRSMLTQIGPGIAIAATGVGAADLVAATVAGSRYGNVLAWAVVVGALLKYVLNEGVARWHLATGTSVLQGWARHLGRPALAFFLLYLVIWTLVVSGGLIVASGLAAHSVWPVMSRQAWGILHSLAALSLVWLGSYQRFEQLMKALVALMFVAIVGCAVAVAPSAETLLVMPTLPAQSLPFTLSLIGGVGGSVTMLVYGYWIEEKQWTHIGWLQTVRLDLAIAYGLTGLFAIGAMLLASDVLFASGTTVEGQQGVIQMASILQNSLGATGHWIFLLGFWGTVFSSLLGIFQGVPYLFADFVCCWRAEGAAASADDATLRRRRYRIYLVYMALPAMLLLYVDRPIWVVVLYAAVSSLFLPFLAITLLIMNNRGGWIGEGSRNGWKSNLVLCLAVGLFIYLGFDAVLAR